MSDQLSVRLFATLKDKAGAARINVALDEPMRVDALLQQVAREHPELAAVLPSTLVAVNRNFAEPQTIVSSGDEVALFPPVSGG